MLHRYLISIPLVMLLSVVVCAQNPPAAAKKKAPIDSNKFALIINGAGGEPAYAKQFEEWTAELISILSEKFGFDSKQVKVLTEKPADPSVPKSTAEEVKRTFASLKSQLSTNNILFVFLIGHGSYDGKESKFNLVGPDIPASEYNT